MLKEAIDRILELGSFEKQTINNRLYGTKPLHPIEEPLDAKETVSTLTGLVDLVNANLNGISDQVFIHVASPTKVFCEDILCNAWGKRQYHIEASLPNYGGFNFGNFIDQERFIIGLQAFFVQGAFESPDLDYLLQIASSLKAEAVDESLDDGFSQRAAVRQGVVLAQNVTIKRRVQLAPYRTFREIAQPKSEFVFRLRSEEGRVPSLALFIADGEMWQNEAMQDIKDWLQARVAVKVVA